MLAVIAAAAPLGRPVLGAQQPSSGAAPAAGTYAPNYAGVVHLDLSRRWGWLPLRVYFDTGGAYTSDRERAARAGFDEWTTATGGVLGYVVVPSLDRADVQVLFYSDAHLPSSQTTVGNTQTMTRGNWMHAARLELATGGVMASNDLLTEVAAHEWGHVLGINGHSQDDRDLMYPTTVYVIRDGILEPAAPQGPRKPTDRDLNTIKLLYADRFAAATPAAPGGGTTPAHGSG
jgi:hypothetical protein